MCHQTLALPAGVYYPAHRCQGSNPPLPDSGHPGFLNSWKERELGGEALWSRSKGGGGWLGVTDAWLPERSGARGRDHCTPHLYPPLTRESGEDRSLLRAWRGAGGGLGARRRSEGTTTIGARGDFNISLQPEGDLGNSPWKCSHLSPAPRRAHTDPFVWAPDPQPIDHCWRLGPIFCRVPPAPRFPNSETRPSAYLSVKPAPFNSPHPTPTPYSLEHLLSKFILPGRSRDTCRIRWAE